MGKSPKPVAPPPGPNPPTRADARRSAFDPTQFFRPNTLIAAAVAGAGRPVNNRRRTLIGGAPSA